MIQLRLQSRTEQGQKTRFKGRRPSHTGGMNASASKPDRTLIVIASGIAFLVIVALANVFSRGEPRDLDEATPAGVVQRYSTAVGITAERVLLVIGADNGQRTAIDVNPLETGGAIP